MDRYSYAHNNPVAYLDPDGRQSAAAFGKPGMPPFDWAAMHAHRMNTDASYRAAQVDAVLGVRDRLTDLATGIGLGFVAVASVLVDSSPLVQSLRRDQPAEKRVMIGENVARIAKAAPQRGAIPLEGITPGPNAAGESVLALQAAITSGARVFDIGWDPERELALGLGYAGEYQLMIDAGYHRRPDGYVRIGDENALA